MVSLSWPDEGMEYKLVLGEGTEDKLGEGTEDKLGEGTEDKLVEDKFGEGMGDKLGGCTEDELGEGKSGKDEHMETPGEYCSFLQGEQCYCYELVIVEPSTQLTLKIN